MNAILNPERRAFLVKSAAAAGGLAIGVRLLPDASAAGAAEGLTEVTHWIVI
ncbi:MAG: twin-arginine translocation signal domain-containing protein, partial [Betaproteobacteria bacterium]